MELTGGRGMELMERTEEDEDMCDMYDCVCIELSRVEPSCCGRFA